MNRIIFKDNADLKDKSTDCSRFWFTGYKQTIVEGEDALYIGYEFPFNDVYLNLTQVNSAETASSLEVSVWNGNAFKPVAELFDETRTGDATLKKSGHIHFEPDRNFLWARESTNDAGEKIPELEGVNIYDRYWIKIDFIGEFPEIGFGWMGQKFAEDRDLESEHPDLVRTDLMSAWQTGKTDWKEQIVLASEFLGSDLKNRRIIDDKVQLLDRNELRRVLVPKVAEIIFKGMGTAYADNARLERNEYIKRMGDWTPRKVDVNRTGRMDQGKSYQIGRLLR